MTVPLPIGRAVLDASARTLAGPARAVRLPDQAVALLAHLAARPGEVVPKLAATDAMYGGGPRRGLGVATMQARVCVLRRALRETGAGADIATVRGAGIALDVPDTGAAGDARRAA